MQIRQQLIAITLDTGAVAVMGFITQGRGDRLPSGAVWLSRAAGWWNRPATDENVAEEIQRTFDPRAVGGEVLERPRPVSWVRVAPKDVPTDRTYRGAWVVVDGRVEPDVPTVRAIALARIREDRAPALEALDREWMRATGTEDRVAAAEAERKRQQLRDLPTVAAAAIAEARTVAEVDAALPTVAAVLAS